ncbi:Protochlorophyllide reductase A, chloroplastic [Seminavis robusta]|uniref:Protochlorophyllide reductase A, chloroplastic n=1 Tax=Seminavis robusta TaxID=568900 RepID=A0A9N8HBI9_9STRA|nr:Protochlorophyllide reductase A, chloroplastic [Seminavis robusta]|eukprot:Sro364_g127160.1 Protochlorophyllide reductase A, chloroplastic (317) ;mRNA; r:47317-48267
MSPPTKVVLITGANAGLGYESARQLASKDGVEKVLLACRNPEKAQAAKKSLEESTGKDGDFYEVVVMDVSSLDSVRKAVDSLSSAVAIDGLILNAGGGGGSNPAELTTDGVTAIFGANVLGHVLLVDLLLKNKKLSSGGSVVLAGSEASRGIPSLGMPAPVLKDGSVEELTAIADGSRFAEKEKTFDGMYSITKLVATLWMSSMARKEPSFRFVTMSPGMTAGTNVADHVPAMLRFLYKRVFFPLFQLLGKAHGVDSGAKRYVDALLDGDTYKTGIFYASKVGATGEVGDQAIFSDVFTKEDYQDNAYTTVHKFIK